MEDTGIRLTANDRFKQASPHWTRVGLLVAVGLHFGLVIFVQPFEAADMGTVVNEIETIALPPEVRIPPPPEAIRRPATPRVAVDVPEDFTIERTTFDEAPPGLLPPPTEGASPADRPSFIPFDTAPVLLNPAEVQQLLQREYPRALREANIEGRVELWLYVNEEGVVENSEVRTSSGNALLDEAAGEVAPHIRFSPAMTRDKVTAVWVRLWVEFQVLQ